MAVLTEGTTEVSTAVLNRPVYRIRVKSNTGRARFLYYTTATAAAKRASWEIVNARHKIYDRSYSVDDRTCSCESNPYDGYPEWADCELHDRQTGYYVTQQRAIYNVILAAILAQKEDLGS